jgi:lysophospholipase L1-like esterase
MLRIPFRFPVLLTVAGCAAAALAAEPPMKFDFTRDPAAAGYVKVDRATSFTQKRGYGFEPSAAGDSAHFTALVPREGNYRVTVALGGLAEETKTTIKAELRRLMVADKIRTVRGETKRVIFIVNTRSPRIVATEGIATGEVRLKAPRETVQEAWAWDDALTLEFCETHPAIRTIEFERVDVPTIFLLGDSTVCDQSKEPYNSWGQMFTRFFKPEVAIANHGESGETYRDSIGRRRLDKILSVIRPGDWLVMQFGHNDQKQIAAGNGGPFTTYQAEIKKHVDTVRARGGSCIIVSPMERRGFDENGKVKPSLADYAEAARQTARELGIPFIDLNGMSKVFYEALGPEKSARAFAAPGGKVDNTHHNNYGSYELAKCIVQSIRDQKLPIAKFIADDFRGFDPAHPDDPDKFSVPASNGFTNQRPLGDEGNANSR